MIRPIVLYPDPRLKQKSRPVTSFDGDLKALFTDMADTMRDASGLGLAAIQVGVALDFMVMDPEYDREPRGEVLALANPRVLESAGVQKDEEGCLSIPDVRVELERPFHVRVQAQDLEGRTFERTFEGLLARCIFHELDHMNGQLFIERLPAFQRLLIKSRLKDLQKQYQASHHA